MGLGLSRKGKIAVIDLYGSMEGGRGGADYILQLNKLRDDRKMRAVVINIDCSGGLAHAAENVYMATKKLAAQKTVVAFVSGYATSGGYLICCAAHEVVALPSSMIGSIGVIWSRPIVHEFLDRLGVQFSVTKSAHLKDMGAFYREMTEEEKAKEQKMVDTFHAYFVDIVAKDRKLNADKVKGFATGEIFLGNGAEEIGLVDRIGDLEDAIDRACELAEVKKRKVKYIKQNVGLKQKLLSKFFR